MVLELRLARLGVSRLARLASTAPRVHVPSGARTGAAALALGELRLISAGGKQLGVMAPQQALALARTEGLELAEMAPNAVPPVWRLVAPDALAPATAAAGTPLPPPAAAAAAAAGDADARRAEALQRRRRLGKAPRVKEVRLLDRCQEHDVGVKIKSTLGFLSKGNVVKVTAASAVRPEGGSASLARATELVERFIAEAKPLASSTGLAKSEGFVATTLEPREAPP
ncbi:hypothetical protein EMIHUDRAFT_433122 [Emiliania huxleyi CCMP1516]|uniref:Translation initiation factor 3 N-terminal domain-containing protein n=2 Tax=Emiliania huxleyi TaxID=2903 RepID=A0A0D3I221_EMIH1|nr:hypothetical protein EMIHUDRAFT_433122 [Emiliania huxleyi CCMP1516]EOD05306.1 hypothetical protein EMIHUDRAFT_433122 [Emiliania huxleyi CCMP1516]|eukprot:XP_005757735.1 hypothetical protein EMIHUDRAFT_433122 [Emiliania huxleyi CCMP1516]